MTFKRTYSLNLWILRDILAGYFKNEFMGSEKFALCAKGTQSFFRQAQQSNLDNRECTLNCRWTCIISLKFMPIYFMKSIQMYSWPFQFLIIQLFEGMCVFIAHSTTSWNVKWKLIWSFIIITRNESIKSWSHVTCFICTRRRERNSMIRNLHVDLCGKLDVKIWQNYRPVI